MNNGGKFDLHFAKAAIGEWPKMHIILSLGAFNLPENGDHEKPWPQAGKWFNTSTATFVLQ